MSTTSTEPNQPEQPEKPYTDEQFLTDKEYSKQMHMTGCFLAYGAAYAVWIMIKRSLLPVILVAAALIIWRNTFNWFTDDSDVSGWKRSGMKLHTDAKTGVQYFSVGGALTPRLGTNGLPLRK